MCSVWIDAAPVEKQAGTIMEKVRSAQYGVSENYLYRNVILKKELISLWDGMVAVYGTLDSGQTVSGTLDTIPIIINI